MEEGGGEEEEGLKLVGGSVFGRCARARSHGGASVALGPKRARPKTLPPTNFRGEAGIILGSFLHHFRIILASF